MNCSNLSIILYHGGWTLSSLVLRIKSYLLWPKYTKLYLYLEILFLTILIGYISLINLTMLIFFRKKFLETIFFLTSTTLKKTLESPLDPRTRRSNQSILKGISPEYSLEWLMLKLKLPILWPPDAMNWLIWKDPDARKDRRQEEKGTTEDVMVWMASLTQWTWVWIGSGSWWWTGKPGMLQSMGSQRVGHDWANELNWTELYFIEFQIFQQYVFCSALLWYFLSYLHLSSYFMLKLIISINSSH